MRWIYRDQLPLEVVRVRTDFPTLISLRSTAAPSVLDSQRTSRTNQHEHVSSLCTRDVRSQASNSRMRATPDSGSPSYGVCHSGMPKYDSRVRISVPSTEGVSGMPVYKRESATSFLSEQDRAHGSRTGACITGLCS